MKLMFIIISVICSFNVFSSEENKNIIYDERVDFNPITYYFNSAFDVIQNPNYFSQKNYWRKHKILSKRITSPNHSIEKDGGWNKFLKDEFTSNRTFPNVGLHTIGSGYDSRMLYEYFSFNNYPYPMAATILTAYLGHLGNESIELSNASVSSHDNIADLYVFDPIGILIFQNNEVASFFHNVLEMRTWGYQPFIDLNNFQVNNAGLNYIFRPNIFRSHIRPFILIGMQILGGLSYEISSQQFITLSSGVAFTDPLKREGYFASAIFYDNKDSLSSSFIYNGSEEYKVRLNLYPNLSFTPYKIGSMIGIKRNKNLLVGVNFILPIGLGG